MQVKCSKCFADLKPLKAVFRTRNILIWIRIRTSDERIRIQIRIWILFFSSVSFKMQKKFKVFLLITFWRYFYIIPQRKHFYLTIEGSGSSSVPLTNGSRSGSRKPQTLRIPRIGTLVESILQFAKNYTQSFWVKSPLSLKHILSSMYRYRYYVSQRFFP